jgi:hypothetical protein
MKNKTVPHCVNYLALFYINLRPVIYQDRNIQYTIKKNLENQNHDFFINLKLCLENELDIFTQ